MSSFKLESKTPIKKQVRDGGAVAIVLGVIVFAFILPGAGVAMIIAGGVMMLAGSAATE